MAAVKTPEDERIFEQPITIACEECQHIFDIELTKAGKPVSCPDCGEYMIAPKARFAPNVVVGDYILRELLGQGGAGIVFRAYQRSLDRDCALKILYHALR